MGIVKPRDVIQTESVDVPLRNRLWDVVREGYLTTEVIRVENTNGRLQSNYATIWTGFWHMAGDEVPNWASDATGEIRAWLFKAAWNEVYDLAEFVVNRCKPRPGLANEHVVRAINQALEQHMSAYRWIDGEFVPITDDQQVATLEEAMFNPLAGVRSHLAKALALASNRENPDEENSIKESISAVESLCSAIVGKKATLGEALKKLKDNGVEIHGALEKAWLAMYGYTSDADGIRHASQDEPNLTVADAMYFMVSCSAFITLLTEKSQEAGLTLQSV